MKNLGFAAGGLGALIMLISFGMDTAPEGTYNIGLLQQQMMVFALACVLSIAGTILGALGHSLTRMEDAGILPPSGVGVIVSEGRVKGQDGAN
jgi:hypothetical protein